MPVMPHASESYQPRLGDAVEDVRRGKVGKVMGFEGPYVQLRPIGGGVEWDVALSGLRKLTLIEAQSAGVAAANARSTGGQP
ncbi:hypothetical protein [Streptomyces brasiliscabiei]|uniref:hypothetical protein n=1 Tax=Streptomyces brasiliscabiei TaxID=2736302 RepID=UPI001F432082|nr:hypothetical protein [Streptomyces brasiliscabiei]